MEYNFTKYKQILLSDRPNAYKPDKAIITKLSRAFPDIEIFGFGTYYQNYWYILAQSEYFPDNVIGVNNAIPIGVAMSWSPVKPKFVLVTR